MLEERFGEPSAIDPPGTEGSPNLGSADPSSALGEPSAIDPPGTQSAIDPPGTANAIDPPGTGG